MNWCSKFKSKNSEFELKPNISLSFTLYNINLLIFQIIVTIKKNKSNVLPESNFCNGLEMQS